MRMLLALGGVALAAASLPTTADAQIARAELRARLKTVAVEYTSDTVVGRGMLLLGEPLEVDLRLWSVGSRSGAEADWYSRVNIELRPGRLAQRDVVQPTTLRCRPRAQADAAESGMLEDGVSLAAGQEVAIRCHLTTLDRGFAPGPYNLVVGWSDSIDHARFVDSTSQPIRDAMEFELRDVVSDTERAELSYRLAFRALMYDKQPREAIAYLDQLLDRHPGSQPALLARAHAFRDVGLCDEARSDVDALLSVGPGNAATPADRFVVAAREFKADRRCASLGPER